MPHVARSKDSLLTPPHLIISNYLPQPTEQNPFFGSLWVLLCQNCFSISVKHTQTQWVFYIIKVQNTLFLSQCFQKQLFQRQHFLKPMLPVGSLEKKFSGADFCKAWCSSQSCATLATYSHLRSLHCAMPSLQPLHHLYLSQIRMHLPPPKITQL